MNFEQMIGDSELKLYVIASGISHKNKKTAFNDDFNR